MNRTIVGGGLVTCLLLTSLTARPEEQTDVKRRTVELTAEVASLKAQVAALATRLTDRPDEGERFRLRIELLGLEGKLEQARAEQDLLRKVTEKTIPPRVAKDAETARLASQAKVAQRQSELLKEAVKKRPHDIQCNLELLAANARQQQSRAEHALLQKEPGMLDDKGLRIKRLNARIGVMQEHLRSVQALLEKTEDGRARAEVMEERGKLERSLHTATADRAHLRNEADREAKRKPKP